MKDKEEIGVEDRVVQATIGERRSPPPLIQSESDSGASIRKQWNGVCSTIMLLTATFFSQNKPSVLFKIACPVPSLTALIFQIPIAPCRTGCLSHTEIHRISAQSVMRTAEAGTGTPISSHSWKAR